MERKKSATLGARFPFQGKVQITRHTKNTPMIAGSRGRVSALERVRYDGELLALGAGASSYLTLPL